MKNSKLITILSVILLSILIMIVAAIIQNINTETIETEMFYQYYGGKKVTYEGTITLENKSSITQISDKDGVIELDSTPLYYENKDMVIFPQNMAAVYPMRNGQMRKVNRFSKIKKEDETIYVENTLEKKSIGNLFLFDGQDLYFFIEETEIVIGADRYQLSPMSYAIAEYNGDIEFYDKKSDQYTIISGNYKDVRAETEDYTIILSQDVIQYDEKEQLLIRQIEKLDNI